MFDIVLCVGVSVLVAFGGYGYGFFVGRKAGAFESGLLLRTLQRKDPEGSQDWKAFEYVISRIEELNNEVNG